jgi:hypothetical protein
VTLTEVAKDPLIEEIISSNIALSHRYSSILLTNPVHTYRATVSIPFSLNKQGEQGSEIKITGNLDEDIETLLKTPEGYLESIFDPEKYVQDEVTEEIKRILLSPEFIRRKNSEEQKCMSPYKTRHTK